MTTSPTSSTQAVPPLARSKKAGKRTRAITPRKMDFPFGEEEIPRYWLASSRLATHMANGLNLLFPEGERFFIRSVQAFQERAEDPELRDQIKGFMGQEVRHGLEHERFFRVLRAQGFDIDAILGDYTRLAYEVIEPRCSPEFCLSVTAALEHYTALFGDVVLRQGIPEAHPLLRDLLLWHAAEEIEHKCVAFDLLQLVDDGYVLRIMGLQMATVVLLGFWARVTIELMRQDEGLSPVPQVERKPPSWAEIKAVFVQNRLFRQMARGFVDYLRPGFHPNQHDNIQMAKDYLERIGGAPYQGSPGS